MIISASRRTDIPAFYAKWFINRLKEGYLLVQNPFNTKKYSKVELTPNKVDAIVFWTKNPKPIMQHLKEIDDMGYKYYFQFTLTGYPRIIEPSLPDLNERLSTFKDLSMKIGANKVIWRYDPILISDITNEKYTIDNFNKLTKELSKFTERVVISFADIYKKVTTNLDRITKEENIKFQDINLLPDHIHKISSQLSNIANDNSLRIFSCAEKIDLSSCGINPGKCIDDDLLKELFNMFLNISKDKNQRDECGCIQSRDIGQYNSCTHNCIYCYANINKNLARKNRSMHNPSSSTLIGNGVILPKDEDSQLNLLS